MGRFLRISNGVARQFDESATPIIYDETVIVGGGGLTTGSPLTLPDAQDYTADELEVYLNSIRLQPVADYNYVGVAPRTQITFTFDLLASEAVRFRIDRGA